MIDTYIGIDPGKSGALCILDKNRNILSFERKMPWLNARLDSAKVYDMLGSLAASGNCLVTCEKVHAMPRDGAKGAFTFGGAYHAMLAVVDLFDFPLQLVAPQTWKKSMLRDRGKEKHDSVNAARDMFPELRHHLKAKSSHNLAEAALIAAYGISSWNPENGH